MRWIAWAAVCAASAAACLDLDGFSGGADAGVPPIDGSVEDAPTAIADSGADTGAAVPGCGVDGPTDGLLAYFPFDDAGVSDCSPSRLSGTVVHESDSGTDFEPGKFGTALHVAAAQKTGCVDIGMPAALQTEPFTVTVWLKIDGFPPTPTTTATGYIFGQTVNAAYGGWRIASAGLPTGGGAITCQQGLSDGGGATNQENWPKDNNWHHYAVTVTTDTVLVYIDGLTAGSPVSAPPIVFSQVAMRIGCRDDDENYFDGAIDELRFYGRVLTAAEIAKLAGH